jgi:hypothetical protein
VAGNDIAAVLGRIIAKFAAFNAQNIRLRQIGDAGWMDLQLRHVGQRCCNIETNVVP